MKEGIQGFHMSPKIAIVLCDFLEKRTPPRNLLSTNNFDHMCQEITLLISPPMAAAGLLGPDLVLIVY